MKRHACIWSLPPKIGSRLNATKSLHFFLIWKDNVGSCEARGEETWTRLRRHGASRQTGMRSLKFKHKKCARMSPNPEYSKGNESVYRYKELSAKTPPTNQKIRVASYLGLLALSQHGAKSGRDHQNSFPTRKDLQS